MTTRAAVVLTLGLATVAAYAIAQQQPQRAEWTLPQIGGLFTAGIIPPARVDAWCDGPTRVYAMRGGTGGVAIAVVANGCAAARPLAEARP